MYRNLSRDFAFVTMNHVNMSEISCLLWLILQYLATGRECVAARCAASFHAIICWEDLSVLSTLLSRRVFGALILAAVATLGLAEEHENEIVLTVTGLSEERQYSISDLREIGTKVIETTTIWTDGPQVFEGVPLDVFLAYHEVTEGEISARAINDYAISFPVSDALDPGPMIAFMRNGETMSIREKGPLWIVYPYDSDEKFQTEVVHSRSIWQLDRIEFKAE